MMQLLALIGLLALGFSGLVNAWAGEQPQSLPLDERWRNRQALQEFRNLGPLRRETVEKVPNPHVAAETLEYGTLLFDGLGVTGLVEPGGGFSPVFVKVSASRWTLPSGLSVGALGSRVVTILGPPMQNTCPIPTYQGTSD